MNELEIRTPEDILKFMNENIKYGWVDMNGNKQINTMKEFRKLYITTTVKETLQYGMGTCIDQVNLMHYLFNRIHIKNKMFCCRIFEPDNYNNLDEEEHMHCFLLYYLGGKVYHIEHPNFEKIGIYEYDNEMQAINTIVNYYINLRGGKESPTKEFFQVKPGLTFKEFNNYINHLGKDIVK